MMTRVLLAVAATALSFLPAVAAEHSSQDYVLHGDTVKAQTVTEGAARYQQKTYTFPTGSIRILEFKKDAGGVFHKVGDETAMRIMKGTAEVEVDGKKVALKEGDVVQSPKGVVRSAGQPEDATILLWKVTGTQPNPPTKVYSFATDAVTSVSKEWDQDGKHVRASKPEELAAAPKDALELTIRRFNLDGNSVRAVHSTKGVTSVSSGRIDALLYVVRGHATFVEDDKEYPVGPGDAIREAAGASHYWKRSEPHFEFVSTSMAPLTSGPAKIPDGVREDAR